MSYDFDLFVIGGGSGGVRAARVSAALGKRVAIAEEFRFGGTCVIRGCVPKKLYVYASHFPEHFEDAAGFGWTVGEAHFDWKKLVAAKEKEITRLEGLYEKNVRAAGATTFDSRAELVDAHTVRLVKDGRTVTAEHILIATGGIANRHDALPGHEHCLVSDDVFDLPELPSSIVVYGGGYIAVEFANIMHGLGVETTLIYRGKLILNHFDQDLRELLSETMQAKGIKIIYEDMIVEVEKRSEGTLRVHLQKGEAFEADQVLLALGRTPYTKGLGLEAAGVKTGDKGEILIDDYSRTNVENIWALGDVTDRVQLTPVAIHEAMCFVETAFKNNPTRPDIETVATAVFSQPEIGTVGLAEDVAAKRYETLEVYRAIFRPMKNTLSGRQDKTLMKLIVDGVSKVVVGAHILGPDAGEMAQLLGIAVKAELTKDAFDRTMAVHPTAAEELVTMYKPSYVLKNGEKVEG
ncbi:glutathione-disulfide reductase [Limoniibacter endophyticus]|uniref:Glutathione reductase n=1 Tax=Limoniibacter endophyticus TaxID=1565040 RepID=A0A8J3DKC1_9HYPH|nr:glutathione-disulfide reductase [Limoniibacter endophyticus]GHC75909.1 glutathione-disulfide reductase [Limoniibacter endophyticus]